MITEVVPFFFFWFIAGLFFISFICNQYSMLVLIAQRPVFAILSRLCLQTKKKTFELADDFISTKHKISEISFIVIEKITS